MKGLRLSVYKSARIGDCTNGGITAKADEVVLVGILKDGVVEPLPRDCQVFTPQDDAPAVVLVPSRAPGYDPTPHLIPLEFVDSLPAGHVGPMSGGNYAGTSDSRWGELGKLFAPKLHLDLVAVHDRIESYRDYLALSQ